MIDKDLKKPLLDSIIPKVVSDDKKLSQNTPRLGTISHINEEVDENY